MRCDVKIVGIGKRRAGTSKGGHDYDFVPVSINFHDPAEVDFKGDRAETLNVPFDMFVNNDFAIGEILNCVMHWQNYKLQLDAIIN